MTARRTGALTAEEVAYWMDEFADAPEEARSKRQGKAKKRPSPREPESGSPFPPGYGEDLLDDAR